MMGKVIFPVGIVYLVSVELVILVDKSASSPALSCEAGLSLAICGESGNYLLDTAATGESLLRNAQILGVELKSISATVLSHGHCDHSGGLSAVVANSSSMHIYANPSAFSRRWVDKPGRQLKDISCPHTIEKLCAAGAVFHAVKAPLKLADWLVLSGPVGGSAGPVKLGKMADNGGGTGNGDMFIVHKGEEMVIDSFEDELFCLVKSKGGWAVVTGCCHRGLRNMLRSAKFLANDEPITAVIGGLHLRQMDLTAAEDMAGLLANYDYPDLYPCHCTSDDAVEAMTKVMPGKVHPISAGSRIQL